MEQRGDAAAGVSVKENPVKRSGHVSWQAPVSNPPRLDRSKSVAGVSVNENQNGQVTWLASDSKPHWLDRFKLMAGLSINENPVQKQNGHAAWQTSVRPKSKAGLTFTSKADGHAGWSAVEKRFDEITKTTDGLLLRSQFGECIGMHSKDFALELFDALARRRNMRGDVIDKKPLKEFWEQINDQSFDTRLMTFFDMIDKDASGRLTEDEVRQIIIFNLSVNNLSTIEKEADEYTATIMEELDPDKIGYIMIENDEHRQSKEEGVASGPAIGPRRSSSRLRKPTKKFLD